MEFELFNDTYGKIFPKGDYETIGGYITKQINRIPHKNEHLFLPAGHIIIRDASSRRIEKIQIYFN